MLYEGEFVWTDMSPVSYTSMINLCFNLRLYFTSEGNLSDVISDWFQGWVEEDGSVYNRQPNDDGLSQQDCVELRQLFSYQYKGSGRTSSLYWNDRECNAKNFYVCERMKSQRE